MNWEDLIVIGRIARPHGLRGELVVDPETDFPDFRFSPGQVMHARRGDRAEPLTVRSARFYRGRAVVQFEGIESIDEAKAIGRSELRVAAEQLERLPEGQYYPHQLMGCEVTTTTGRRVGSVVGVEGAQGSSRLVVEGEGGEILVPLAETICVQIDLRARAIVIEPPEGLLELND